MKKVLTIISILGLFALNGNAQVKREVKPSVKHSGMHHSKAAKHKMMKNLNLSKEQKGQMKEFNQSVKQRREAIKNDASLNEEQKKQRMMQLHKEKKQKMQSILTPEQREKYKKEKKEMKKSHSDKNK